MNYRLTQELKNKEKQLIMLQEQIKSSLQKAPEGKLRITHKKGKSLYYHKSIVNNKASYYGRYIRKNLLMSMRLCSVRMNRLIR